MKKIEIETLYQSIINKEFLKKYDRNLETAILDKLCILDQLKKFSWSTFCCHLFALYPHRDFPDEDLLISLDLLGIATRILDDLIDDDNPLVQEIGPKLSLLLCVDLLTHSLSNLSSNYASSEALSFLQQALEGEFYDLTLTLKEDISEKDYFDSIIKKSTDFFLFVLSCLPLSEKEKEFWHPLLKKIGTAVQIKNDIHGLIKSDSSDISALKATFPLIKFVESNPKSNLSFLINNEPSTTFKQELMNKLDESGTLDYSILILTLHQNDILASLTNEFPEKSEQIMSFLNYINLGESNAD
ncbi:polyprenyl synthetase family protein [Enterococcus sp. LJL99]